MGGWIKIYDKLLDWEWHDDPAMLSLWIHLLLLANYEDNKWHGIVIKRGQLVTSLASLNEQTGLSIQQIRTCLGRLRESEQITSKSTNKYTVITICNYEDYQEKVINKQQTPQQTNNNPTTTTTEYKNNRYIIERDIHACAHTHEGWSLLEEAKHSASLEAWCMQNHTTKDEFFVLATEVVTDWEMVGEEHPNRTFMKRHFFNTIRIKLKEKRNGNTDRKTHSEQVSDLYAGVAARIARRSAEDDARKG